MSKEQSDCCGAEKLIPFGEPFDMGDAVCAECGQAITQGDGDKDD